VTSSEPAPEGQLLRCPGGCPPGRCEEERPELEAGASQLERYIGSLAGSGSPLDPTTRASFEHRLGHDFSKVRIHADASAAESARAADALAYTVGHNVVFGAGQYRPATSEGRRLLAHELTHVVQQAGGSSRHARAYVTASVVQRQAGPAAPGRAAAPAPAYGRSCSPGVANPCQSARCTPAQTSMMPGALGQAMRYVNTAIGALGARGLSSSTRATLRWYFASDSEETATAVRARLQCIRGAIADTQSNNRFGCHPDEGDLAYVCVHGQPGAGWACKDEKATICITDQFPTGARARAEVLIHEHAHRIGLSAGSHPDIYRFQPRFPYMSTEQSFMNSDSIALFAGAVAEGVRVSLPVVVSVGGGGATPLRGGRETWQARLYGGTEFQHPVLGVFSPTLGVGLTLIGDPQPSTPRVTPTPSLLASLVVGLRIGESRPGARPAPYVSFFGGPALATGRNIEVGAEAGVAWGFRWRWVDISAGIGYTYDPVRAAGLDPHLLTGGVSLTFVPWVEGSGF
jgi:hypothetical protein